MGQVQLIFKELLRPTRWKRVLFFLLSDIVIIIFSFYSAFYLRFGFTFPDKYIVGFRYWLGAILVLKIAALAIAGLYNINWRFVGFTDLMNLIKAGTFVTAIIFFFNIFVVRELFPGFDLPRGIIVIDAFLSFVLTGMLRIAKRIYIQVLTGGKMGQKTMIIGADYTGERLIKELQTFESERSFPVVIVDENPMRIGTKVCGLPILGGYDKIPGIIREFNIQGVLINLPRASHKQIASIFDIISPLGLRDIKVVPRIDNHGTNLFKSKSIKQLDIEDLLSREPVKINQDEIDAYIRDKSILVTGAAGSIGSEILRQLINFKAGRVIALEIDETELFNLELELKDFKRKDHPLEFILGDVREKKKVEEVFELFHPQVVFHSAAYKHVPMMEKFPAEAVKTNIIGTLNIVEAAVKYNCEKMINISTDKAVNPSSVMGASKRMAELIGTAYNKKRPGKTPQIVSVRFGNVLGSRGSAVPIFLDQIKRGGPIEVTHKDMKRYFMSLTEAVLLVFQAAAMGRGGEVFVLDMGEPVNILHLAETLIRLNNLKPYQDIDIVFTGLRPGEKMFEELLTAEEGTMMTAHEKIFIARNDTGVTTRQVHKVIKKLGKSLDNPEEIKSSLKEFIPFYR